MTIDNVLLISVAAMFALMGLGSIARPISVTKQFGIDTLSIDGRNEVRAVCGGLGLAMTAILFSAVLQPNWKVGIVLTAITALGRMALGRIVSAIMERSIRKVPIIYLVIELAGVGLLLQAL